MDGWVDQNPKNDKRASLSRHEVKRNGANCTERVDFSLAEKKCKHFQPATKNWTPEVDLFSNLSLSIKTGGVRSGSDPLVSHLLLFILKII